MATEILEEKLFVDRAHIEPIVNQVEINIGGHGWTMKGVKTKWNQTMNHLNTQYEPKERYKLN